MLPDVQRGPLGGGVFNNVKMHDAAAVVSQHDEDKEHAEVHRWYGEEIAGHDVCEVVVQEGPPRW